MKILGNWQAVVILIASTIPLFQTEQAVAEEPMLSLAALEAGLASHPPHLGDQSERQPLVDALDAWVNRPDTVYWDNEPTRANREFFQYYLGRIQKVLNEVQAEKVESGVMIWKLYSSGLIVKTPETVFAIDVVEGPFKKIDRSPADDAEYLFKWTPAMRAQFAETVDTLFITHRHYDHTSYALVKELIAHEKTVVVPEDLKERTWKRQPFYEQLTVLGEKPVYTIGQLQVRVFHAVQAMQRNAENKYYVLDTDPDHNVYLIRTKDGTTFLHNGDNRGIHFMPWLKSAILQGWKPDVWFKILAWPKGVIQEIASVTDPLIIPAHEYEMGHKPKYGTSKLGHYFRGEYKRWMEAERLVVLTWGEKLRFEKL
ncbi:MAG: hypothetical protein COA78_03780 [Blastopirellula sp.]|nr:MAG: hypothetical protein COA78_03780 [Blastopirellula sp.]